MKTFSLQGDNGKALANCTVVETNGVSYLKSYNTTVAEFNHHRNEMKVCGWYSKTTAKHINKFLEFYGFDECTKKELIENYNLTENI